MSCMPYVPHVLGFFLKKSIFHRRRIQNKWDCLKWTLTNLNCLNPLLSLLHFNLSSLLMLSFHKQCSGVTLSFYSALQNHQPPTGHWTPTDPPAFTDHRPTNHTRINLLTTYRSSTEPPTTDHRLIDKSSSDSPTTNHFISNGVNNKE